MMSDKFNFRVSESLANRDPLGLNYVYSAVKHEEATDIYTVTFHYYGKWQNVNYEAKQVEKNIADGTWIIV